MKRCLLLCSVVGVAGLTAADNQPEVVEKDLYNTLYSPGFLWALLSIVVVAVVILVAYVVEKRYNDGNRPKKNIKLEP